MKHKLLGIIALCAVSLITNNSFAAKANLTVMGNRTVVANLHYTDGNSKMVVIQPNKTVSVDAWFAGFTGADWVDCGKQYSLDLPQRIEGIEGERTWQFLPNGILSISASGLLPAFLNMQGKVISRGECPCVIQQP